MTTQFYDEIQYRNKCIQQVEYAIIQAKDNRYYKEIVKTKSQKKQAKLIEGYKRVGWFDYEQHLANMESMKQRVNTLKAEINDLQKQWDDVKKSHAPIAEWFNNEPKLLCDKIWHE